MIKIISSRFRNFKSYGNVFTEFSFDKTGMNLVKGENLDSPNVSNGAGKSALMQVLLYTLYGKSDDGLKDNDLINNINNKNLECEVVFQKDKDFYKVYRYRKTSDGNGVKLYKSDISNFDDVDEITLDSISHSNKKIEEILGISFELFIRVACFSANNTPFFSLSARSGSSNQSSIIEELFELLELAEKAEILKLQLKENEQSLKIEEVKLDQTEQEQSRINTQIESTEERITNWDNTKTKNIKTYSEVLDHIKDIDFVPELENHEHYNTLKSNSEVINVKLASAKKDIKVNDNSKIKLENELNSLLNAKCPYCEQSYDNAEKLKDIETAIEHIHDIIENKKDDIEKIIETKDKLEEDLIDTKSKLLFDSYDNVKSLSLQQNTINAKIEEIESEINPYIETLKELKDLDISSLNYDIINKLTKDIEHQKFLYKLLTNKNSFIRKTLLDKHIPYLNDRLYYYLNELDLPHIVKFGHDLSAQIHKFGKKLEFGNLSNGQKSRVNMALSLSFRDILEKIYGSINVLILDEILDVGLDQVGIELAIKILRQKINHENISMFIITHRSEMDSSFDNIINIQMKNNFSEITI